MKKLVAALAFLLTSLSYLSFTSISYAGNCFNLVGAVNPEVISCYDTTCRKDANSFHKEGNVKYFFRDGTDCTRTMPLREPCPGCKCVIDEGPRTCSAFRCNQDVTCASPSVCLPPGYNSTSVCGGGGTTTSGGGCIQVTCGQKQCSSSGQCQTAFADGLTNWNIVPICQTTSPTRAGYCSVGSSTAAPPPAPAPAAPPISADSCIQTNITCTDVGTGLSRVWPRVHCCPTEGTVQCDTTGTPYCQDFAPPPPPPPPPPTPRATPTLLPWLQTTGGDVHSNTNINTPGGP